MRRKAEAVLLAVALAGCAAPGPAVVDAEAKQYGRIIARNDNYVLILTREGDRLEALAERYYGDASRAAWLAEINGIDRVRPNQIVAVPLESDRTPGASALGVSARGYQTVPVLCYHRFGPGKSKLVVSQAAFEAQMAYLARNGYRVLPLARLREFLEGKQALPPKTVMLTIDDGYKSTYEIAYPILKKYGFPATVFLYSDFVGATDALSWPQMQEMSASGLVSVQPHSKTHSNLALKLAGESEPAYRERLRQEVAVPTQAIQDKLGVRIDSFAFPYGYTNESVSEQLERHRIPMGFTVTPGANGFFAYPRMLRRSMVFGDDDLAAFAAKLAVQAPIPSRQAAP